MTGLNVTVCIYTDEELGRWLLAQIVKVCICQEEELGRYLLAKNVTVYILPLLIEHAEQQNQGFTVTSFHGRIVPSQIVRFYSQIISQF